MYALVKVVWDDAGRDAFGWSDPHEIDTELPTVETVGFLFKETDTALVVVQSIGSEALKGEEDEILFALTIPKGCIREVYTLTCPPKTR